MMNQTACPVIDLSSMTDDDEELPEGTSIIYCIISNIHISESILR